MPPADEIMTPVSKPEAVAMAEIHAMRGLTDAVSNLARQSADSMAANTRVLEKLTDKVDGMNTRLTRLEEAKHGREIDGLKEEIKEMIREIDGLKSTRDQQRGAKALVDWLRQTAPWLVAVVMAVAATVGFRGGTA